jgi:hypothetical protein
MSTEELLAAWREWDSEPGVRNEQSAKSMRFSLAGAMAARLTTLGGAGDPYERSTDELVAFHRGEHASCSPDGSAPCGVNEIIDRLEAESARRRTAVLLASDFCDITLRVHASDTEDATTWHETEKELTRRLRELSA